GDDRRAGEVQTWGRAEHVAPPRRRGLHQPRPARYRSAAAPRGRATRRTAHRPRPRSRRTPRRPSVHRSRAMAQPGPPPRRRARGRARRRWRAAVARGLTADQAQAVYGIVTSGRAIDILVGPAGTGKTRTVAVLADIWKQARLGGVTGLTTSTKRRPHARRRG